MYVGVLSMRMYLHGVDNLKAKRRILLQIKDRVKAKFNASVAEVDDMNIWQSATLGFSVVSNDGRQANSALDHIASYVDSMGLVEVTAQSIEILSVKEE